MRLVGKRGRKVNPDFCRNGHPRTPENTLNWDLSNPYAKTQPCKPCVQASARRSHLKRGKRHKRLEQRREDLSEW